jgi:hypothetical protein
MMCTQAMANGELSDQDGFEDLENESMAVDNDQTQQEDEQWSGIAPSGEPAAEQPAGQKGLPRAPPSRDELRAIHNATSLFRNSTFKLQVCVHPYNTRR